MSNHCCLFVYWYQSKVRGILGTFRQLTLVWETSVQILVSTISFSVFGSQSETEEHYHTIHFYFIIYFLLFFLELVSGLTEKKKKCEHYDYWIIEHVYINGPNQGHLCCAGCRIYSNFNFKEPQNEKCKDLATHLILLIIMVMSVLY